MIRRTSIGPRTAPLVPPEQCHLFSPPLPARRGHAPSVPRPARRKRHSRVCTSDPPIVPSVGTNPTTHSSDPTSLPAPRDAPPVCRPPRRPTRPPPATGAPRSSVGPSLPASIFVRPCAAPPHCFLLGHGSFFSEGSGVHRLRSSKSTEVVFRVAGWGAEVCGQVSSSTKKEEEYHIAVAHLRILNSYHQLAHPSFRTRVSTRVYTLLYFSASPKNIERSRSPSSHEEKNNIFVAVSDMCRTAERIFRKSVHIYSCVQLGEFVWSRPSCLKQSPTSTLFRPPSSSFSDHAPPLSTDKSVVLHHYFYPPVYK